MQANQLKRTYSNRFDKKKKMKQNISVIHKYVEISYTQFILYLPIILTHSL